MGHFQVHLPFVVLNIQRKKLKIVMILNQLSIIDDKAAL